MLLYDDVVTLDDKVAYIRQELLHQVETGTITRFEQKLLLDQNTEKVASLMNEQKSTAKALQRKERLEALDPIVPHGLKQEVEIYSLRKERIPLLALEKEARGRLLTLKETQTLARKVDIDEEIAYLEEASRGWFEDDDVFESRLEASRAKFETKQKKKALKKMISISADTTVKMKTKWLTPQEQKAWAKKEAAKRKKKQKGGCAFSSMIMDSSSEEEDSDEDDDSDDDNDDDDGGIEEDVNDDNPMEETATSSSAKRKRKKKKGSKQLESSMEKSEAAISITVVNTISILASSTVELLLTIVVWLVSLVFGKAKKVKGR